MPKLCCKLQAIGKVFYKIFQVNRVVNDLTQADMKLFPKAHMHFSLTFVPILQRCHYILANWCHASFPVIHLLLFLFYSGLINDGNILGNDNAWVCVCVCAMLVCAMLVSMVVEWSICVYDFIGWKFCNQNANTVLLLGLCLNDYLPFSLSIGLWSSLVLISTTLLYLEHSCSILLFTSGSILVQHSSIQTFVAM